MKKIILYTDGGCRGNQNEHNIGAIGGILIYPEKNIKKEYNEGFKNTTNNKMELLAIIKGLSMLKEPCDIMVHTDSAYVVNAYHSHWIDNWKSKNWTRGKAGPLKNAELWQALDQLVNKHQVTFVKVKGHANDALNNRADALVNEAMDALS